MSGLVPYRLTSSRLLMTLVSPSIGFPLTKVLLIFTDLVLASCFSRGNRVSHAIGRYM